MKLYTRRLPGQYLVLAFSLLILAGYLPYQEWIKLRIEHEWQSRLAPLVNSKASLAKIQKIAESNHWNYVVQLPVPGTELKNKKVVFDEKRTLWFPFGYQDFAVSVQMDSNERAKSFTVTSRGNSF